MTHANWEGAIAPTSSDSMDIRAANTAAFNLYVDITIFELLRFELKCGEPRVEVKRVTQWLFTSFFSKLVHLL